MPDPLNPRSLTEDGEPCDCPAVGATFGGAHTYGEHRRSSCGGDAVPDPCGSCWDCLAAQTSDQDPEEDRHGDADGTGATPATPAPVPADNDLCTCGHRFDVHEPLALSGLLGCFHRMDRLDEDQSADKPGYVVDETHPKWCTCDDFAQADQTLQRGSNSGGGVATAVDNDVDPGDGQSRPEPGPATPPPLPVLARILDHAVTAEFGPADNRGVGEVVLDTIIDEANRDTVAADLVAVGYLVPAGHAYLLDDGTVIHPIDDAWPVGTRVQLYRIGGGA